MSDNTTGRHTMRAYADELKRLHAIVLEMSERVRTQIRDAVNSLEHESPDEAWLVFEAEKRVNELNSTPRRMTRSSISSPSASRWPGICARSWR
ncbi:MAG: hypothetical protein G8D28_05815 [gamma proteobacterium symbiont of Phacoides pectinatus]